MNSIIELMNFMLIRNKDLQEDAVKRTNHKILKKKNPESQKQKILNTNEGTLRPRGLLDYGGENYEEKEGEKKYTKTEV